MKYAEIKHLQEAELRKRLQQARHALFTSRMKHKMQRLSNTMELRNFKRDIAQLETVLAGLPKKVPVKSVKKDPALKAQKASQKALSVQAEHSSDKKDKQALHTQEKSQKESKFVKKQITSETKKVAKTGQAEITAKTKVIQKKGSENKTLDKLKSGKKEKDPVSSSKPKKWFGLLSSKLSVKDKKPGGLKSFFKKKSI